MLIFKNFCFKLLLLIYFEITGKSSATTRNFFGFGFFFFKPRNKALLLSWLTKESTVKPLGQRRCKLCATQGDQLVALPFTYLYLKTAITKAYQRVPSSHSMSGNKTYNFKRQVCSINKKYFL